MKTENKNFLYNILYQLFIFIIPLITTPYISRKLGVNNIGIYSYSYSIVSYFMLVCMLGINNYGSREIAKVSKDKEKISQKFWSIYIIQLTMGVAMLLIYYLLIIFVWNDNKIIFAIQGLFIISSILDINWLFFGLEKFKITISRNIIIKTLSLILVFIFVKNQNDLLKYVLILSISTLISQIYLWTWLKKYISFEKIKKHDVLKHIKPCLILFIPVIAYSIYRIMDKTMLGLFSGTTVLGYYENAEKVINIPISIITALGTVMLPSVSKEKNSKVINEKIFSSFKLILCLVVPMIIGLCVIAEDFSLIFFGEEFINSAGIIQMLSITILFSAIANVIRTNYLIPSGKDKIYVISTIIGAVINFIINLLLIPRYGYYGACIGTIVAEFLVMIYQVLKTYREIDFKKVFALFCKNLLCGVFILIPLILINYIITYRVLKLVIQLICAVIIFFLFNFKFIINEFLNIKK